MIKYDKMGQSIEYYSLYSKMIRVSNLEGNECDKLGSWAQLLIHESNHNRVQFVMEKPYIIQHWNALFKLITTPFYNQWEPFVFSLCFHWFFPIVIDYNL